MVFSTASGANLQVLVKGQYRDCLDVLTFDLSLRSSYRIDTAGQCVISVNMG